jgi:hypothetical protein
VFDRGICCFFLNSTLEVHKELLVRCSKTIQHICINILVLNKTIIFVRLTKIIQILDTRPKLLGSGNHVMPKSHEFGTTLNLSDMSLGITPNSIYLNLKSGKHTKLILCGLGKNCNG